MDDAETKSSTNWSTAVEDLVDGGDLDGAISLLETLVSKLETLDPSSHSHLPLASALSDLANLYSSKGFSLKADAALSRASLIKLCSQNPLPPPSDASVAKGERDDGALVQNDGLECASSAHEGKLDNVGDCDCEGKATDIPSMVSVQEPNNDPLDDDWEAIADREPDELLTPQCLPSVSKLSLGETKDQPSKRRGRGTFSYRQDDLYSDRLPCGPIVDTGDDARNHRSESSAEAENLKYGTRHVLVLADFPPSTKTIDLEKLFEDFQDRGVSIRWVNDTVALAVFRTPSIAHEAYSLVRCPFTVRLLDEDDMLLSSVPARDLDPPRPRPQTSARTAKRLIAQGMGLKLPSPSFGSRELRKQEDARRNRIVTRQIIKDDAWGPDE